MAKLLVTYYTRSGNTEAMARIIEAAARKDGAEVVMKRVEEVGNDDLAGADAVAVGSPDYFSYPAGQVKTLFDDALAVKPKLSGKRGGCFASHGGGGRIKEPFEGLMKAVGFRLVMPCVLSQNEPAGDVVDELHELARLLAGAG